MLKNAPKRIISKTYMFTNGIKGNAIHVFQAEVFTSTPAQADVYSALTLHVHVTWNENTKSRILDSEAMIMIVENNEITLTKVNVVLNIPRIIWPEGQMMITKDKTLTNVTPYGGGQTLDMDTDKMNVTFITHRG